MHWSKGGGEEEERWVMTKVIEHFLARLPPSILAVGPARS